MLKDTYLLTYAIDILIASLHEVWMLLPYLYLTYLAIEYLELKASNKTQNYIKNTDKYGVIIGSLLGLIPQCGFSVVAANLYTTGIIALGTLFAIFLSTSDELLPILISGKAETNIIFKVIILKLIFAILAGYLIERFLPKNFITQKKEINIEQFCKQEKCHCDKKNNNIYKSALKHTERTGIFIFICCLIINTILNIGGIGVIKSALISAPILSKFIASFAGLIPSCYPSILFGQLYNQGIISASTMLSGTLSNAGVGFLVLYRINKNKEDNIKILGLLFIFAVVFGIISSLFI